MPKFNILNLPEFIQVDIFHQLESLDDLASCSLVCRKWHSLVCAANFLLMHFNPLSKGLAQVNETEPFRKKEGVYSKNICK